MAGQRHQEAGARVSVLLHPLVVGSEPIRWRDWSRRSPRRACIQLVRHQCVKVEVEPPTSASLTVKLAPLSRAKALPTIGFRGQSGWLAMRVPSRLDG